jgi:hypothetical protein
MFWRLGVPKQSEQGETHEQHICYHAFRHCWFNLFWIFCFVFCRLFDCLKNTTKKIQEKEMSIEAMKQALDVLENTARSAVEQYVAEQKAITVLRQAIEQAEKQFNPDWDQQAVLVERIRELEAQLYGQAEKQEPDLPPVGIGVDVTAQGATVVGFYRRPNAVSEMFYSEFHPSPPRKEWVELTDTEINELDYSGTRIDFVRAIEAKLKEKNT